ERDAEAAALGRGEGAQQLVRASAEREGEDHAGQERDEEAASAHGDVRDTSKRRARLRLACARSRAWPPCIRSSLRAASAIESLRSRRVRCRLSLRMPPAVARTARPGWRDMLRAMLLLLTAVAIGYAFVRVFAGYPAAQQPAQALRRRELALV